MPQQEHVSPVTSLSLTPDGWTLLTAARDQTAALWDLRAHTKLATVPTFEAVEGAFSPLLPRHRNRSNAHVTRTYRRVKTLPPPSGHS